jgi:Icc-related predicted phosphoesterase
LAGTRKTEIVPIRIAAAGDVHAHPSVRARLEAVFAAVDGECELVLLAGDLTAHGEPDEAVVLADACRLLSVPVVAVLGNHDWHANRRDEVVAALAAGDIAVLDPGHVVIEVEHGSIGIAGVKGFVGGFPGSSIPDFGEPLLREVYRAATEEVEALDRELDEIADCSVRIALLHYAPTIATIEGEPEGIWSMLGSSRLAEPIKRHRVDIVLHGHAHLGAFEGRIGRVPVYNVAVPVLGRDFWIFHLDEVRRAHEPPDVRVEAGPSS